MGLGITPEYDDLLARGYPHLRRLVTPHPHEADVAGWARKLLDLGDPKYYFVDWPAAVARAYVRGYARSRGRTGGREEMYAAAVDGPLDEAEGRALIAAYLDPDHETRYDFHAEHALFLIEAMIGSAATADAVLAAFEGMTKLDSKYSTRCAIAYDLGFVLRRLPAKQRKAAEARVDALVARHPESFPREFLSYLTGGREALIASERRLGLYCVHFSNSPELIREIAADSVTSWDAQHVVLAGDALIDALTPKRLRDIWKPWKPLVIEQLGVLASPKVIPVLEEFGKTKAYAKQVEAILAARGVRAKPAAKAPAKALAAKAKPTSKAKPKSKSKSKR